MYTVSFLMNQVRCLLFDNVILSCTVALCDIYCNHIILLTEDQLHLPLAVRIVQPYPNNVYAISGSAVNFTCIFVGDNNQPPLRVTFQRSDKDGIVWSDIKDSERMFQTNETQGD